MPSKESDRSLLRRSAKRRSLLPLLIFFILLLMLSSGVLIFLVRNHLEASKGQDSVTRLSAQNGFECEYSEALKLYPFSKGVLKVTASRVAYISVTGTEIYGVDIQMDNPFCVIRGNHALVADSGGFFCALFDENGLICEKQLSGAISFGTLSSDGMAGLIIEQPQTKGAVYLLDKAGNFLAQWNSVESGYPICVSFSPDDKRVDISLIDTDGSTMQPRLKQIGLPSDSSGQKATEIALYTPDSTSVLSSISYIGKDITLLAGISEVLRCENGSAAALTSSYTQILSVLPVSDGTAVIYADGVGQEIRMDFLGADFTRSESIVLGNQYIDSDTMGNKVVVSSDEKILIIHASDLKIEKTITVDQEVLRIGFIDLNTIMVVTGSGVYQLSV